MNARLCSLLVAGRGAGGPKRFLTVAPQKPKAPRSVTLQKAFLMLRTVPAHGFKSKFPVSRLPTAPSAILPLPGS